MPDLNNIDQLRKWFRGCPALSSANRFRVDYLGKSPVEYALYSSPSTIAYRENVLGETVPAEVQTLNFIFASKESYGPDVEKNLANMGFYDDVCSWIQQQNMVQNFPQISGGRVISIVPTLTAFPIEAGSDSARYQIQMRMVYRRT